MKKIILILSVVFFSSTIQAQGWQISSVIKGSSIEPKYSTIDSQNNLYVLSLFSDSIYNPLVKSYGANDLAITKYSPDGTQLWIKRIGNRLADVPGGITTDNNFIYITGNYYDTCKFDGTTKLLTKGNADIFLAKYSLNGDLVFAKRVGSASTLQSSLDIKFDGSQKILMVGYFKDTIIVGNPISNSDTLLGNSFTNNFIAVYDQNGELQWSKKITGNNNSSRLRRIEISQNGYYFGGYYQGSVFFDISTISSYSPTTYDAFLYKTDFDGNGQWVRRIRGTGTENFRTLTSDEYDNVYVLGNYNSPTIYVDSTELNAITYTGNSGGYDTYICKYNRSGVLQWFIRKGSTAKDIYNDFVVRNNVIYATGFFTNQIVFNNDILTTSSSTNSDAFLAAFNEIGDPIAGVSIKGTGNYEDAGTIVNMDANSRAYVAGYYKSQQIQIGSQTYTSSNLNKSDLFFAIYQHPLKAVFTRHENVTCYGLSNGVLGVTPYFGKPPYTYTWSHDASLHDAVASNLAAGTYTVTITDANNNQNSTTVDVTQPLPLAITGTATPVSCINGSNGAIDITVTGGTKKTDYLYNWSSIDGSGTVPLQQDQTGLSKGTYTILVKDDNLCSKTADFIITEPGRFSYSGTVITNITIPPGNNGAINLALSGGNSPYSYAWSGPSGFTAGTEDLTGLTAAGLYNLSLTDSKSCHSDTSFAVLDGTTLVAQITSKTDVLCFGQANGTAEVTVNNGVPPYSYQWSDGFTTTLSNRSGLGAGIYTVLVSDAATPTAHTAQATVTINGPASALGVLIDPKDLRCYHDTSGVINVTVTGGTMPYNFTWNTGYSGEDLVRMVPGSYSVTVTDANNCIETGSATISEPEPMTVDISLDAQVLCHGEQTAMATANATGGVGNYAYLWNDPGAQITKTAYDLFAGTYKVKVTDQNDCFVTGDLLVIEPDSFSYTVNLVAPACAGDQNGSIIPAITGGTAPYEYEWSNNVFDRINNDIPAGSYSLTLTDKNNCRKVIPFTLQEPDTVKLTGVEVKDVTCFGDANGNIILQATGGTGNLHYSFDNGLHYDDSPVSGLLPAGAYTLLVRDDNNCTAGPRTETISQPDPFVVDTLYVTLIDALHPTGSVALEFTGGVSPVVFVMIPDSSSSSDGLFQNLAPDDYRFFALDDSSCRSNEILISIEEPFTGLRFYDAFSPNADGKNDVWHIPNIEYYPDCMVKIFNSWGTPVFSSKGYGTPWDGKSGGNDLPSGTYYYLVDPGDGSPTLSGPVSLVK